MCEVVSGSTPKSAVREYWGGFVKWVTPAELSEDDYYVHDTERHLSELGVKSANLHMMPVGTVLLSSRAPIGKVAITAAEMTCNQGFKNLICSSDLHNRYLYYFLKKNKTYLNSLGRGATFKEISKEIVADIKLPLPPLKVQNHMADILDKITFIIDLRKQQLNKLDLLIKSQFIEMFGDPIENPLNWETLSLKEVGNCKNGMNYGNQDSGYDIRCLGVADFQDHSVIENVNELQMLSLNCEPQKGYWLQDGDIVFVRSNGNKALVGRCVVVYPGDVPTVYSGFCIRFRKTTEQLLTEYLIRYFKMDSVRAKMAGRGANIQNLNQQILAALIIPIPPVGLQKTYIQFVKQSDKSKFAIRQSLKKLELAYHALMQEYFG